ncbi:MAG: response regulator [Phycisphaerae bacterium]|nr:response regulator [Phycisphaerae bacterium]
MPTESSTSGSLPTGLVLRAFHNPWRGAAVVGIVYAAAAQLSLTFSMEGRYQPVFYPACGVGLALVLLAIGSRGSAVTGIGIAACLWAWANGLGWTGAVGFGCVSVVSAAVGAAVLCWFSQSDQTARTFRGTVVLIGPAAGAAAAVAGLAAVAVVAVGVIRGPEPVNLWRVWTGRALADMIGVLLAAPIVLWLFSDESATRKGLRRFEGAAVLVGALIGSLVVFRSGTQSTGIALAMLCLPIPVLVLAATRLGPAGTSATGLIVGSIAVWYTNAGLGPFAALNTTPRDEILAIQAYTAITTGSALLLAAAVRDWGRSERLLRRSEGRYREFVSHSTEGVWCIDMEPGVPVSATAEMQIEEFYSRARLGECNDAMAKMYGLTKAEELIGKPLGDLLVRDDPRNIEYLRAFIASGYRLENAESHERDVHGGTKVFLNSLVGVVEGGHVVRAWGSQRDITEAKRAERELERTRARLAAAMDATDMASWTLDIPSGLVTFDETVRRLYDLGSSTPCPLPADVFLSRIHPDDAPRVRAALEAAIRGESDYRAEFRVPQTSGVHRWITSRGLVRADTETGTPLLTGFCTDVSESHHAADEREQLHAQLRQAQKLESLGLMAGGIAHDFNNLLVGILGSAGLALSQVRPGDPVAATISNIEISARRAADLTRQLLAYAGKVRISRQPVSVARLIADVLPMLQSQAPVGVTFTADLSPGVPPVMADSTQLQQVLINLATNAREAVGRSGGEVRLRTGVVELSRRDLADGYQHAEGLEPGWYVFLEVTDTGKGMDEQTVSRIFDPFFTTKFTGRGLGLAVVLGIVRGHGGAIRVTSMVNAGSTFRVILPAMPAGTPSAVMTEPKPAPTLAASGRVLIVDDEAMVRDVTSRILARAGWESVMARDGTEALAILSAGASFDAVILDATMPGLSGFDVLRELRRDHPGLPVLLSSGYTLESLDGAGGLSADGFLQKPFSPEVLARALAAVTPPQGIVS